MSNIGSVTIQIPDIVDAVKKGESHVLPLNPNTKECTQTGWNTKEFSAEFLATWQGNFGLRVQPFKDGHHLVIIDIDGTLSDKDVKGLTDKDKNSSKKLLKKILFKELDDCGMLVETASTNGAHIYLKVRGEPSKDAHELSQKFTYPIDCGIENLEGKPLGNALEIFGGNKNRYIVLPGSQIDESIYKIAESSNFNKILELPLTSYAKLESRIENALERSGFRYIKSDTEKLETKYDVGFIKTDSHKKLSEYNITKLAEFLIPIYKHNDGAKYYMTLPLSGYLSKFVEQESAIALGEEIIRQEPNLFKDDQLFIKTLLGSYDKDKERKTGATTLYEEYAKDVYPGKEFWFKLIYYTNSNVYFYPTGKKGNSYKKILFNTYEKQIEVEYMGVNKKGEEYTKSAEPVFGFQLIDMKRIENPIIKDSQALYEFSYIPSGTNQIHYIVGENMRDIEQQLKETVGLVLSSNFKPIFNQIITQFNKINFVDDSITSSVPGIFEIDGKIRRFDYNKEEVDIGYDKETLINAVNLLEDVRDVFPTYNDKLGHIIRIGLTLPYHHIFKHTGHMSKYLVLGGAGGALKSTISEMLVNFYNPTDNSTKQANIYGGGQFGSLYQVGKKYGISSYPFVVNEPGAAFQDEEIIEVLKSAVESDIARTTNDGNYYSYSTAIFATNIPLPQKDSFLRRCDIFHFENFERASEEDIKKVANLLNKSKKNDRFVELKVLGDFCFTYLSQNKHLFKEMSIEDLQLHLIEQIEKETGKDLSWLKETGIDDSLEMIDELDNEVLSDFLQCIKDSYNYHFSAYHMATETDDDENVRTLVRPKAFGLSELKTLAIRGLCPVISYDSNADRIRIAGVKIKNFFQKEHRQIITYAEFYNELFEFSTDYDIEKIRFVEGGKRFRGISVEPELILDLLNNDLRIEDSQDGDDNDE